MFMRKGRQNMYIRALMMKALKIGVLEMMVLKVTALEMKVIEIRMRALEMRALEMRVLEVRAESLLTREARLLIKIWGRPIIPGVESVAGQVLQFLDGGGRQTL